MSCIWCASRPRVFPSGEAKREFYCISNVCPVCWHMRLMPPDASAADAAAAADDLATYGLELSAQRTLTCRLCAGQLSSTRWDKHKCVRAAIRRSPACVGA